VLAGCRPHATGSTGADYDLVIVPAGRAYGRTYQRKRPPAALSGVAFYEGVSADGLNEMDLLALALGSNKDLMVELRGFEPLTPSMRTRCVPSANVVSCS
jgi:hypothetical protein